jgi:hypothetical protein
MLSVESKNRLTKAFRALRREGLVAKQKFMCCRNCAGTKIGNDVEAMPEEERAKIKGAVFYTTQDAEPERNGLYLAYGPIETEKHGTIGEHTRAVGARIVKALRAEGLKVKWDGSPNTRIHVEAN